MRVFWILIALLMLVAASVVLWGRQDQFASNIAGAESVASTTGEPPPRRVQPNASHAGRSGDNSETTTHAPNNPVEAETDDPAVTGEAINEEAPGLDKVESVQEPVVKEPETTVDPTTVEPVLDPPTVPPANTQAPTTDTVAEDTGTVQPQPDEEVATPDASSELKPDAETTAGHEPKPQP